MKPHSSFGVDVNAPVILAMTVISLLCLLANTISNGWVNSITAAYYTAWNDPSMYLRLFTHIFSHADLAHYTNNFLMILAVGPMVEEKYGSIRLAVMIAVTALITGLINVIFFQNVAVLGASGIVFMLILLASFTNIQQGKLPLTVLLVGALYIGNEMIAGFTQDDNISRISHIAGGLCGAVFGFFHHRNAIIR